MSIKFADSTKVGQYWQVLENWIVPSTKIIKFDNINRNKAFRLK